MKKVFRTLIPFLLLALVLAYYIYNSPRYLQFSDSAKFADIARNLVTEKKFATSFVSPGYNLFQIADKLPVYHPWIPPLMPFSIVPFYLFFGISDFAVIMTSVFYYLLLLISVYFLSLKYFGKTASIFCVLLVALDIHFMNYAISGSSETLLTLEIVLTLFLVSYKNRKSDIFALILLIFMYFTRPQAFIYILGTILYWLLLRYSFKKTLVYFLIILFAGLIADRTIFTALNGQVFLYSITSRGMNAMSGVGISQSPSEVLRGGTQVSGLADLIKKTFYNLYNYYRLMPQIMNPYFWGLFVIGLFRWGKNKVIDSLKLSTIFMTVLTFVVSAMTIPFFRYIHPIIPLVYLFAVDTLVWIVGQIYNPLYANGKQFSIYNFRINKQKLTIITSAFLMMILAIGQAAGVIFLDTRFERKTHNIGKPPVYAQLSWILRDNTDKKNVIITNLDTWGSWYGERNTVWFTLEPKQLIDPASGKIPFDAIYLTDYLINDENYYMGESWRQIYNNPYDPERWNCEGCSEIKKEFELKGRYTITASDNYQNESATSVLLVRR